MCRKSRRTRVLEPVERQGATVWPFSVRELHDFHTRKSSFRIARRSGADLKKQIVPYHDRRVVRKLFHLGGASNLIIWSAHRVPIDSALPWPHHWDRWRTSDTPVVEQLHPHGHPSLFHRRAEEFRDLHDGGRGREVAAPN